MPIFRLEDDELIIAQETNLELESHLEDWLENSPRALTQEPLLWIGRQTSASVEEGTIFPDLLGVDIEGNLIIVELKRDETPREVVAQLLEYAAWANELSDSEIHKIAEDYFETRDEFEAKTFDDACRETFDIPETDGLPPLNQRLRLFIVAEEIHPRVAGVCRFLRTSHGIDITCIDISTFQTESGEILVSMEAKIGDEDFAAPKAQRQHTSPPRRWSGDKSVKQVVWDAIQELTQGKIDVVFEIREVTAIILKKDPNFNAGTVNGQITADCVNHPSRRHHPSAKDEYYWRVGRGKYRLYDSENDKVDGDDEVNQEEQVAEI